MLKYSFAEFMTQWPADKAATLAEMKSNKDFNLIQIDKNLKRKVGLYATNAAIVISKKIPKLLLDLAALPFSKYKIEGSVGKGQPVEIPWIGVFNKEITTKLWENRKNVMKGRGIEIDILKLLEFYRIPLNN